MKAHTAAQELFEIQEEIRMLEHKAAGLKAALKTGLEPGDFVVYGSVSVELTAKERATLDRAALEKKFGAAVIAKFEKVTEYLELKVRRVA